MDHTLIEYVKFQLNRKNISFDKLAWAWTKSPQNKLEISTGKGNLIDGILILNFGINLTGSGVGIRITDLANPTEVVYENTNAVPGQLVAPSFYFVKGDKATFGSTVVTTFGFNYITIRKDPDHK